MNNTPFNRIRLTLLAGCAALALAPSLGAAQTKAAIAFDIPAQDLDSALTRFGQQSDREIIVSAELTRNRRAPTVRGDLTPDEALKALLADSGLSYRTSASGSIVVEATDPQGASAGGGAEGNAVDALVVTAQKKEEAIQDVPIAISAFSQKSLEEQKIEGGFDLLKAVPNVTFSKNNFTGYNFSIRGIGTKAVSATTDPAVAVAFNSTPLIRNRLFEQEYFDIERVEVLRGPQGTLYGRNATSGVVNVITAKPRMDEFSAMLKGEAGNYNARRVSGFVNVPLTEGTMALRVAGAMTQRDGFGHNLFNGEDVDGRDLWSSRVTLGVQPGETVRADFVWEHFEEDDDRQRTGKQLCHRDEGPDQVGSLDMNTLGFFDRAVLSQGCLPGSLYDDGAFGVPNGLSMPFILHPIVTNYTPGIFVDGGLNTRDPYDGVTQSHDLRAFSSEIASVYRAKTDIFQLNLDIDITDSLTFTSQTAYTEDEYYASQDFNRFNTRKGIFKSTGAGGLLPGGYFDDPQLGRSNAIVGMDLSRAQSTQFSQEFRLASNYDGPFNFNVGVNYLNYETVEDYFVFFNIVNILAYTNVGLGISNIPGVDPPCVGGFGVSLVCVPIDDNPIESITGEGRNYFRSQNPYEVNSTAAFGEVYYEFTPVLKLTLGLRYTDDKKQFTPIPSETLLTNPTDFPDFVLITPGFALLYGQFGDEGYPVLPDINQHWQEVTGRLGLDWKPELGFTDDTMLYAFYSRGYKGGGANPPGIGRQPPPEGTTFLPEFVDAFELGAKNTLLGGAMVFNASAFYYDYKDYQVSKIVDRSAANENFDATIWGLEFETVFQPTRNLRFNANLGYLDTELAEGAGSIDLMNRTAGNPDWAVVRPFVTATSSCIVRVTDLEIVLPIGGSYATAFCPGGALTGDYLSNNANFGTSHDPDFPGINGGAGFDTDVGGNELPNAPHWTFNAGAQYTFEAPAGWTITTRGDFYWQSQSFARIYNTQYDKLRAWKNANVSVVFAQEDWGLAVEAYVKNVFDDTPITDAFLNSDDTALTTNIFVLDPRLIGVSVRKAF